MMRKHVVQVFAMRRDPRNTQEMDLAQFIEVFEQYQKKGTAWAIVADGVPIAIGGVCLLRAYVGEIWLVPTPLIEKYPVAFSKITRMVIDDAWGGFSLHRLQAMVRADDPRALKFTEQFLGFADEGLMRKYGSDGADYRRFARG
jgi:hypothetical protein